MQVTVQVLLSWRKSCFKLSDSFVRNHLRNWLNPGFLGGRIAARVLIIGTASVP